MREVILNHADLLALAGEVLEQGGLFRFDARGSSMAPFIRSGNTITIEKTGAAELRLGDIVLYVARQNAIVHRLVGREGQILLIRGDSSRLSEPDRVSPEQVLGRVLRVQRGVICYDPRRQLWRWLGMQWQVDAHWIRIALIIHKWLARISLQI